MDLLFRCRLVVGLQICRRLQNECIEPLFIDRAHREQSLPICYSAAPFLGCNEPRVVVKSIGVAQQCLYFVAEIVSGLLESTSCCAPGIPRSRDCSGFVNLAMRTSFTRVDSVVRTYSTRNCVDIGC